jgi:hypothetical protein
MFLPALLFCTAPQADEGSKISQEELDTDAPVISVAAAQKAMDEGKLYCQTDGIVGTHITKLTVCDLGAVRLPTGAHYRFVLEKDGLHPLFCNAQSGCEMLPSVWSRLESQQHMDINAF